MPGRGKLGTPRPGAVLGLDEAGRGSLLGPLVVGAFAAPSGSEADLRELGVADSKLLTPHRREEVYACLPGVGAGAWRAATPAEVDRYVRRGRLNVLELELMAELVVESDPASVEVDACDPDAERFGRRLHDLAARAGWSGRVLARHKADRDLARVGAASIVAKVQRDRHLARLNARTQGASGSGYPSDPVTRRYVAGLLASGAPLPPWVRRSWATLDTLKSRPPHPTLEAYR